MSSLSPASRISCIMNRIHCSRLIVFAVLVSAAMTSTVRGGELSYMFQVTQPGLVSTLNVDDVGSPVSTYQINGLNSSDSINAASYDPNTNRLYYVDNLTKSGQAQLEYVQLNATGMVVGQITVGILPQVTASYGADYYDGRVWISQQNSNIVYGYDPNSLGTAPITLTLPTPSNHTNTDFVLGDLTFNDATKQMFIAGNLNGGSGDDFVYEYQLNGTGTPTLIASRDYTASDSDPRFNGIIFNQSTDILYGYYNNTGQLYTIDTTTLEVASDVGSNPALFKNGDLAGFSAYGISSVPEPSSIIGLGTGMLILLTCRLIRMRIAAVI